MTIERIQAALEKPIGFSGYELGERRGRIEGALKEAVRALNAIYSPTLSTLSSSYIAELTLSTIADILEGKNG